LYWKTARDLGYDLDVDEGGGYFVTQERRLLSIKQSIV
jgi:hypothetical protein